MRGAGSNLLRLQVDDLLDRIGKRADDDRFVVEQDLDDHDAGVARALGLRHLEAKPEVDDRNHAAAQIDDSRS